MSTNVVLCRKDENGQSRGGQRGGPRRLQPFMALLSAEARDTMPTKTCSMPRRMSARVVVAYENNASLPMNARRNSDKISHCANVRHYPGDSEVLRGLRKCGVFTTFLGYRPPAGKESCPEAACAYLYLAWRDRRHPESLFPCLAIATRKRAGKQDRAVAGKSTRCRGVAIADGCRVPAQKNWGPQSEIFGCVSSLHHADDVVAAQMQTLHFSRRYIACPTPQFQLEEAGSRTMLPVCRAMPAVLRNVESSSGCGRRLPRVCRCWRAVLAFNSKA